MADLDLNKMHILVEFHQEGKYSVLRLKKAVNLEEPIDFASWDTQTSVEVLWNGKTYPGYILQFGEIKKDMDAIIDKLAAGAISVSDIPILQDVTKLDSRIASKCAVAETSNSISHKKQKLDTVVSKTVAIDLINEVKSKFSEVEGNRQATCNDCANLKSKIGNLVEEKAKDGAVIKHQSERIVYLENKISKLKTKYKSCKEKCKRASLSQVTENHTLIGSTNVRTNKLNMCRTSSYARFVGDLLEVVFGREVLGNSLLKGIKGPSKKTNILDPEVIKDIQAYVATKFNIDQALVRHAIRRKLNIADRVVKETCKDDVNK